MLAKEIEVGLEVAYRPHAGAPPEYGVVTERREGGMVMVRYGDEPGAKATRVADLTPRRLPLKERLRRDEVTIRRTYLGKKARSPYEDTDWRHHEWRVTLHRHGRSFTTEFRCGLAWENRDGSPKPPSKEDVLEAILSDCATVENRDGFEDWARDLGYDTDSRRAEKAWIATMTQAERVKDWLGSAYDVYLWETEGA